MAAAPINTAQYGTIRHNTAQYNVGTIQRWPQTQCNPAHMDYIHRVRAPCGTRTLELTLRQKCKQPITSQPTKQGLRGHPYDSVTVAKKHAQKKRNTNAGSGRKHTPCTHALDLAKINVLACTGPVMPKRLQQVEELLEVCVLCGTGHVDELIKLSDCFATNSGGDVTGEVNSGAVFLDDDGVRKVAVCEVHYPRTVGLRMTTGPIINAECNQTPHVVSITTYTVVYLTGE